MCHALLIEVHLREGAVDCRKAELTSQVAWVVFDVVILNFYRSGPDDHRAVFVVDVEGRVDTDYMHKTIRQTGQPVGRVYGDGRDYRLR